MTGTVRLLRLVMPAVLMAALSIGVTAPVAAQDDDAILEEMIALEQSKLDPWFQNDVAAYMAEITDETTYFDPNAGRKLTGEGVREFFRNVYAGTFPPGLEYELTDTSVVVRGDVVVFTFHIDMSVSASGDPAGYWMVTKVLERTDDGWEVIHTHFGLPAPPPEEAPEE
jgi:ketosteroid isomerase-like protein